MKIIVFLLIFVCLFGCELRYDIPENYINMQNSVCIESESIFSVNGELFLKTNRYVPVIIYNPNNHEIVVYCGNVEYAISPYSYLAIKSAVKVARIDEQQRYIPLPELTAQGGTP